VIWTCNIIYIKAKVCLWGWYVHTYVFVCLFGGGFFSFRSVLRNREDLHFWKNWMTALMACILLYSLYNFVCLSLCESDGCGPYRNHHRPPQRGFVRFETTYIFWKNWIMAPVAGQRHNNGVAFSLGSVLGTQFWAKVVFSFRSVLRLLLGQVKYLSALRQVHSLFQTVSVCPCGGVLFGVRSETVARQRSTIRWCLPSRCPEQRWVCGNVWDMSECMYVQ
jgi:hypothetical protein